MELLMEKLRSKASTFKPLVETAKNMRMAMVSNFCYFNISRDAKCISYFFINRISDSRLTVWRGISYRNAWTLYNILSKSLPSSPW